MTANSRPVRTTRTTPRTKAAAPAEAIEPMDDYDEADAAEAQEIEAEGHYVTAMLAGEEIRVVPPGAWRQSWQTLLAAAQFNGFAKHVVHPDDLELYFDIDPTNDEFEEFVSEAAKRGGESLGKSRGPARSSRRTRRR
jgi:hypothetical protein